MGFVWMYIDAILYIFPALLIHTSTVVLGPSFFLSFIHTTLRQERRGFPPNCYNVFPVSLCHTLSLITTINYRHLLTSSNVIIKCFAFVCFSLFLRATNFIQLAWNFYFGIFVFHICNFHILTQLGILDLWIYVSVFMCLMYVVYLCMLTNPCTHGEQMFMLCFFSISFF